MVGNWGNKKTYIVLDVLFEETPAFHTFYNYKGDQMNIIDYYQKMYSMKITDKEQPLFLVKLND